MRLSLNISINLILLVVILAMGSTIGFFFISQQRATLRSDLEHRVEMVGRQVTSEVYAPLQKGELGHVGHILEAATADPEVAFVMVKSLDGEVLAARWMKEVTGGVKEYDFPVRAQSKESVARSEMTFGTITSLAGGNQIAVVAVGVDLDPITKTERALIIRTAMAVVLGSVIALSLGLAIVRRLLNRSINPLLDGIRTITSGDFSSRVHPDPHREIAEIGAAFNDMAERFSTTLIFKHELEETVTKRTAQLQQALEDQIRVREALAEREEHIRLLFNSTAEAIFAIDRDGTCSFCNPACATVLGYDTPEQIVGNRMHRFLGHTASDGTVLEESECPICQTLAAGHGNHNVNDHFRKKDGTAIPVEYWSHPILRDEELVGCVVTFLDISQRNMLERQLLQAQKLEGIGVLAGGIAHDFNNLLTAIIGGAEIALYDVPPQTKGAKAIHGVLDAATRAADLTRQILAFSRKQVMTMKELNLNDEVLSQSKMLRRLISEDIKFQVNLAPEELCIRADAAQLQQVLLNLAVNARDAMAPGGSITIETTAVVLQRSDRWLEEGMAPGKYAVVSVSDTGAGMDEETRSRIFEPFFTTKGPGEGTGLGLSTVHGVVKQHQGSISVYSEPGKGTTFRIYLPRIERSEAAQVAPEAGPIPRGSGKVLVVEDEVAVRDFLESALQDNGFSVTSVGSAPEAMQACATTTYDLMISDVVMPGMSGPELYQAIRESQPQLKVMFISGYPAKSASLQDILKWDAPFLAKPFSAKVFLAKTHELMQSTPPAGHAP
ncbi:hybrid sensor histidine kinase/response regulator [Geomonas anaerohicana]|uniref:histidine kinase n=1 Tax=Geomonas anaerohicana TaxID=2798583 RepID=A0ABS0YDN5_9BACT|nr:ATP-binding protein [Geomonas anaerohicana]MBJ6750420.1 response regulator [Geomonas anaerohicana]